MKNKEISENEPDVFFVGYKSRSKAIGCPTWITALYLSKEKQQKFIDWYKKEIEPKINEKLDALRKKRGKNER